MGKEKKEKRKSEVLDESVNSQSTKDQWDEKLKYLNPISQPLASRKLMKKLCKTIKKADGIKHAVKGIKEVSKAVRKGGKGVIVLAGDTSPIDVYSHMPVVCEEANIPYCYVPSRADLGSALGTSSCIIVMVKKHEDYAELYEEVHTAVKDMPLPL